MKFVINKNVYVETSTIVASVFFCIAVDSQVQNILSCLFLAIIYYVHGCASWAVYYNVSVYQWVFLYWCYFSTVHASVLWCSLICTLYKSIKVDFSIFRYSKKKLHKHIKTNLQLVCRYKVIYQICIVWFSKCIAVITDKASVMMTVCCVMFTYMCL